MQTVPVHMLANEEPYANGHTKIRNVEIPTDSFDAKDILPQVFRYGQNDFQPRQMCSVSVGDVAQVGDHHFLCCRDGWRKINHEQFAELVTTNRRERRMTVNRISENQTDVI